MKAKDSNSSLYYAVSSDVSNFRVPFPGNARFRDRPAILNKWIFRSNLFSHADKWNSWLCKELKLQITAQTNTDRQIKAISWRTLDNYNFPTYLCVLVNETQGVGHVMIPQVNATRSDPIVHFSMDANQDLLNRLVGAWTVRIAATYMPQVRKARVNTWLDTFLSMVRL